MSSNNILETPVNQKPQNGMINEYVKAFLQILQDSRAITSKDIESVRLIDALIEEAGEVSDTSNTPKKTNSQIIPLAVHKAMAKTRFPYFWLECDTLKVDELNVVTSAFYDLLEKSDLVEVYENKSGGMKRVYEVGDTILKYGINPKTKLPHFAEEDFTKFFPSVYATEMRTSSGERSVRQAVVTFMYSWEQACAIFEEHGFKGKASIGRIPSISDLEKHAYDDAQLTMMDKREVEVAIGFDLDKKVQIMFAGSSASVIYIEKGDNFPWIKGKEEEEAFVPLVHLKCITKSKGFSNLGFGHVFYKTSLEERRNKNSGLVYMGNNVNAKQVLTVGNISASEWNKHSQIADQYIAKGRPGVIPISDNRDQKVSLTTLRSEPLSEEFERITNVIEKDILRWFNIDSNFTDNQKTLGALQLEEESQDLILKQISRNNVREIKFALELISNFLEKDVVASDFAKGKEGDKRVLRVANRLKTGEKVIDMTSQDAITLGELAEVFQNNYINIRVQGESGVKSSDTLMRMKIDDSIQKLAAFNPSNPAISRLMKQSLELGGINMSEEEEQATSPPQIPGQQPAGAFPQIPQSDNIPV